MCEFALAFAAIYKLALGIAKYVMTNHSSIQLFACGPVLYPLDWFARSQLESRSFCDTRPRLQQLRLYIPFTVGQSHVLV